MNVLACPLFDHRAHEKFSQGQTFRRQKRQGPSSTEGQEYDDLGTDLFRWHVFYDEQNIIDRRANGLLVSRNNETGHCTRSITGNRRRSPRIISPWTSA